MAGVSIDKEIFIKWLEEKTLGIEAMSIEDVEKRIQDLMRVEFYGREEARLLFTRRDKLSGRNGLNPATLAERAKLITDPNIKVNWADPREKKSSEEKKQEKEKKKSEAVNAALGFDLNTLIKANKELRATAKDKPVGELTNEEKNTIENKAASLKNLLAGKLKKE